MKSCHFHLFHPKFCRQDILKFYIQLIQPIYNKKTIGFLQPSYIVPSKPHIQNFKPSNSATVTLCVLKRSLISLQLTSCPLLRKCLPVLIRICECKHSHLLLIPVSRFHHFWSSPRPISSSQLHTLLHFHLCPIYLVVFKGSYFFRMGYLILRGASRLDAFSVYPFRAWLLGHALGRTADTPAARPSRSSRTKDSSSQISYAHAGQGPNCLTTF